MAKKPALVAPIDADAIATGGHGDPFAVLGPHQTKAGTVIRSFQPQARRAWVLSAAGDVEMDRVHPGGLFAAAVDEAVAGVYRLRVEHPDGRLESFDDPYRFPPLLGELDIHLLVEGTHLRTFEKMGSHCATVDGVQGVHFAVWAPNAKRVSVVGDFNGWDGRRHVMRFRHNAGVWELFVPGLGNGTLYKYEIIGAGGFMLPLKADPYGHYAEVPPKTASVVWDLADRQWLDGEWMTRQQTANDRHGPISIYEVHLASWRRVPEDGHRTLSYVELADQLSAYVKDMGFTHVELLPIHEHPFSGSWGYQPVGLFAPTSRFGTPEDFRTFTERLHQNGVGVIVDWVAGHFPSDPHGLHYFDGTHLYEHEDPRQGYHQDWNTLIYNYGRREVRNYLVANALYWLEEYHVDGLRVDAVASMLYLDYSREAGEWIPNKYGGNENLEAIDFIRTMNETVYGEHPGAMTVAEESTAWPMVSRPVYIGGLGFGYKWNMGWMHDTLSYIRRDPIYRKYHHDQLTLSPTYAFAENFVLPISHDEVVHGKGSLLAKMPGDRWQKFANLRMYLAFMFTHPGKKLLFMGCEFGQEAEWNHNASLDWHVLADPLHAGTQQLVRDLNAMYRQVPALHQRDCAPSGFEWIDCTDWEKSIICFLRRGRASDDIAIVVCNFTPEVRHGYCVGVPWGGLYRELLNTDAAVFGGSNIGNAGAIMASTTPCHGRPCSLVLTVPPLATLVFVPQPQW